MPLKPSQLLSCLQDKQAEFRHFDHRAFALLHQYRSALAEAANHPFLELPTQFSSHDGSNLGAFPLEPNHLFPHWVIPCQLTWGNREQSLQWVRGLLTGIKTFAVDGSQISPGKDLSIPVALVQVGWFENLHLPSGGYTKDIQLDVLTPSDLKVSHDQLVEGVVSAHRFQLETQRLVDYMNEHHNDPNCLVFFDGSLVPSFAEKWDVELSDRYVSSLKKLIATSERTQVPLVAYVDTSHARDLTVMLEQVMNLPEAPSIQDAQLLDPLMKWGDRTLLFQCRRSGILSHFHEQQGDITFTYLKSTREGYPARLEFPRWIIESGRLNQVIDWIRGELIIGNGYPYVIETADQAAVLKAEDRQTFYRILQDWAEEQELKLRFSRKMVSKTRRR